VSEAERLAGAVERLVGGVMRQGGAVGAEPSPLSTTQAMTLRILADEGPLRLSRLAERLGTTGATASRTVDVLEAMRLLRRLPDPLDGRGVLVDLTAGGERWVRHRREALVDMAAELLHGLRPGDQRRLVELVSQLTELLAGADRATAVD
jgi:DNA-binding MarR family transcriptional regulator